MKAQNFLIVAILPLTTLHNANAAHRLVASTSSSTGTYCWDDLDCPDQPVVVTCNCNSDVCGNVDYYPSCESETDDISTCYLGSRNGIRYFCDISAESTCSPTTTTNNEYGCAAGYYQSCDSGASMTCTQCPSSSGATGTTTCAIPANTSFSDASGSGRHTSECCYTK